MDLEDVAGDRFYTLIDRGQEFFTRRRPASPDPMPIRNCLAIGLETIAERDGIPAGRAQHLFEALDGLRTAMDILGPPTFGLLRPLAHWATQGGGVKVNEDELLAEVRAVGGDEWEQAKARSGPGALHRASRGGAARRRAARAA